MLINAYANLLKQNTKLKTKKILMSQDNKGLQCL